MGSRKLGTRSFFCCISVTELYSGQNYDSSTINAVSTLYCSIHYRLVANGRSSDREPLVPLGHAVAQKPFWSISDFYLHVLAWVAVQRHSRTPHISHLELHSSYTTFTHQGPITWHAGTWLRVRALCAVSAPQSAMIIHHITPQLEHFKNIKSPRSPAWSPSSPSGKDKLANALLLGASEVKQRHREGKRHRHDTGLRKSDGHKHMRLPMTYYGICNTFTCFY